MQFENITFEEAALKKAEEAINSSLRVLVLDVDKNNNLSQDNFGNYLIINTAKSIFIFAAQLVLYRLVILKKEAKDLDENGRMDDLLRNIWTGNLKITLETATSLLIEACSESNDDAKIFSIWRDCVFEPNKKEIKFSGVKEGYNLLTLFKDLIDSLSILRTAEFDKEKNAIWFKDIGERAAMPLFPFIYFSQTVDTPYYFNSIDYDDENIRITYKHPTIQIEPEYISVKHSKFENIFMIINQVLGYTDFNETLLYLFQGSYRYIKNIASAIIDATPEDILINVKENISRRYSKEIEEMGELGTFDNLIVFLLAAKGPTEVCREIFRGNAQLLALYLDYFETKGQVIRRIIMQQRVQRLSRYEEDLELLFRNENINELYLNYQLNTDVWCFLYAAGLKNAYFSECVEPIETKIQRLKGLLPSDDVNKIVLESGYMIERVFRFLILFYSGLEAYYILLSQLDIDNIEDQQVSLLYNDENCEQALVERATILLKEYSKKKKAVSIMTPGDLVGVFRENILNHKQDNIVNKGRLKEAISILLGRNEVCNKEIFEALTKTLLKPLNNIKHDTIGTYLEKPVKLSDARNFLVQTIKLLEFLKKGYVENKELEYISAIPKYPVYPIVVSCKETLINLDKLSISAYEVYTVGKEKSEAGIRILTNQSFYKERDYYCLPHEDRYSRKILLEPFLIPCYKIDSTIMNFGRKTNTNE